VRKEYVCVKAYLTAKLGSRRIERVIENFRHKGLAKFFTDNDRRNVLHPKLTRLPVSWQG
jgi:hypothetical protein